MGLIQSLGFFDKFLTYASWFFENFQIQRTGVVAWEDWQITGCEG